MSCVKIEKILDSCIVSFTLQKSFELPAGYLKADTFHEEIQEMLVLGAQTYEKREEWIRRLGADEIEGSAMQEMRVKSSAEMEVLRRRLAEALDSGRADVERMRRDSEAQFSGKIAALSGQVEVLEHGRRMLEKEVRDRVVAERDEMWRRVQDANALRLADMEKRLAGVEERRRELENKLSARVAAAAAVGASSALRGAAGEVEFGEVLAGAGLVAESTGKQSHMCDYKGQVGNVDVFYEVKNHLSPLKEAEVLKFLRDMKEHPEVGVGVFCALQLPLPGGRRIGTAGGGIVVEWLEDRRMVIYVGELLVGGLESAVEIMKIVRKFVEAGARVRRMLLDAEADDSGGVAMLVDRIERTRSYVEIVGERVRSLFNKMRIDQKTVAAIHDSSISSVKMMREEIKMCVGALLGETIADEFDCSIESESKEGWVEASSPTPEDISGSVVFIPEVSVKAPRKRGVKKATSV